MKKLIMVFVGLIMFQGMAFGVDQIENWADLWNNFSYNETNFEGRNFRSAVLRPQGRFGVYLFDLWAGTRFMPYFAYQGVASGNPSPWNNNVASGIGFRFYPFKAQGTSWMKDIKFYFETLGLTYLKDSEGKPNGDTRIGLDLWYEWNQSQQFEGAPLVNYGRLWGETWANISYHQTNFSQTDFNGIITSIQVKNGLYLGGGETILFEPYLRTDLAFSGRQDFWLNNITYGLGVRVQPFRKQETVFPLLHKLKLFLEVLNISYINQQPADGRPNSDLRFGLDLSLGR